MPSTRSADETIKLLKIDCEGSGYETLHALQPEVWRRIRNIRGEFHINGLLESKGYSIEGLRDLCVSKRGSEHVHVSACRMAE
jgi:hypothetical protein